jgi:hypothetical protein
VWRWQQRCDRDAHLHAHGSDDHDALDLDSNDPDRDDLDRDVASAADPAEHRNQAGDGDRDDDAALADHHAIRPDENGHRHADGDSGPDADGHRCRAASRYDHGRRDDHLGPEPGSRRCSRRRRRLEQERRGGDEQHAVGGWIAFGILAATVLLGGLVSWLRRRRSGPTDGGSASSVTQ